MEILYHYTKFSTLVENILPMWRLLANNLENLNDPKENQIYFFPDQRISEAELSTTFKDIIPKVKHRILIDRRVLCFCQTKRMSYYSLFGYALPRMWTQYGNNHRGACIALDKKKFIKENKKIISDKGKVGYSGGYIVPKLDIARISEFTDEDDFIADQIRKNRKELFFKKHMDWRGENEFRFFCKSNQKYFSIADSIMAIFIGESVDDNYFPAIQLKRPDREIDLYKMWNLFGESMFAKYVDGQYKGELFARWVKED